MRGKPITRRTVLSRRDAMTADARALASERIAVRVEQILDGIEAGAIVALYAPKGSEVETARIDANVRARGLRVAYPRIVDGGERRLAFCEVTLDELAVGHFGLREPQASAPAIELSTIAAFVIPGIAFDRSGGRIGWGRGYYDATLAAAGPTALRIGIAFDCQLQDELPRDPHDAALHYVVTELATHRGAAQ